MLNNQTLKRIRWGIGAVLLVVISFFIIRLAIRSGPVYFNIQTDLSGVLSHDVVFDQNRMIVLSNQQLSVWDKDGEKLAEIPFGNGLVTSSVDVVAFKEPHQLILYNQRLESLKEVEIDKKPLRLAAGSSIIGYGDGGLDVYDKGLRPQFTLPTSGVVVGLDVHPSNQRLIVSDLSMDEEEEHIKSTLRLVNEAGVVYFQMAFIDQPIYRVFWVKDRAAAWIGEEILFFSEKGIEDRRSFQGIRHSQLYREKLALLFEDKILVLDQNLETLETFTPQKDHKKIAFTEDGIFTYEGSVLSHYTKEATTHYDAKATIIDIRSIGPSTVILTEKGATTWRNE